ncbi:hypothetical protein PybrP1_010483 [[Pythium] brassicae (nom. inval.)]|nr:hypothetical protein PybrP1_010483 [[Pythium] brassicae (nom. inval.)]
MTGLQLYANFISQPARAVAWVLKTKNVKYELIQADFGAPLFTSPEFLKLNPNGLIPVIKDGDFSLYEGNAILVLVPLIHSKINALTPQDEIYLKNIDAVITKNAKLLETGYLVDKPFIAGTDAPTLADYVCYCEVGQTALLGVFDFSAYPKLTAWLARMKSLEHHDEMHAVLSGFLSSIGLIASEAA